MSYVIITPVARPEQTTRFELGPDVPTPSGGTANWEQIKRPRRRALTDFEGEDPLRLKFDLWLNEWPDGDVEPLIRRVMAWAARTDLPYQPTTLKLAGPLPYVDLTYVLETVEHTDKVAFRDDGRRCRQQLKLTLLEYVPAFASLLTPKPPVEAAQQRAQAKSQKSALLDRQQQPQQKTYTVKRGDSLWGIAAALLGAGSKYQLIASENNIRDPKSLKPGQVLRIPSQ